MAGVGASMGAHGELTGEGKEKRERGRGLGWHGEGQGAAGGAAMEGLEAALLFVSRWGCSLLRAAVCEKDEGRRKEKERRKQKEGKEKKEKKKYEKFSKHENF
jgi:hypothetical protein